MAKTVKVRVNRFGEPVLIRRDVVKASRWEEIPAGDKGFMGFDVNKPIDQVAMDIEAALIAANTFRR